MTRDRFWECLAPELPWLQRFCLQLTADRDDANDLLQDAVYKALRSCHRLRAPGAFKAWLYQVTISTFRSRYRRRAREREHFVSLTSTIAGKIGDADAERIREARETLSGALRVLSTSDQALVILRALEGWSYSELAPVFEVSEGAVRLRFMRAKEKMRSVLAAEIAGKKSVTLNRKGTMPCVAAKSVRD